MAEIDDAVSRRFRTALDAAYGDRIERVWCSSAPAREAMHVRIPTTTFLKGPHSFGTEARALAEIESAILFDTGVLIDALPLPAGSCLERTGLMQEVRRDGSDL